MVSKLAYVRLFRGSLGCPKLTTYPVPPVIIHLPRD